MTIFCQTYNVERKCHRNSSDLSELSLYLFTANIITLFIYWFTANLKNWNILPSHRALLAPDMWHKLDTEGWHYKDLCKIKLSGQSANKIAPYSTNLFYSNKNKMVRPRSVSSLWQLSQKNILLTIIKFKTFQYYFIEFKDFKALNLVQSNSSLFKAPYGPCTKVVDGRYKNLSVYKTMDVISLHVNFS